MMTAIMTAIRVLRVASVVAVATAGVACSPIVGPKPGFDAPAVPAAPTFPPLGERLDGQVTAAQPVLTIQVPASAFRPRRSDNLDQLAGAVLPATSFNAAPLGGALQTVLEDAGVGLVFTDPSAAERLVTVALPRGTVHEQVAALCSAGRAWCSAAQGGKRVEVSSRATFVVELPPLPASSSASGSTMTGDQGADSSTSRIGGARTLGTVDYGQMEAALKAIVGDAKIDRTGRTIVYKATLDEAAEAGAYFDQLKRNNALILTETIIAEVTYNTSNKIGIHWNRLQAKIGGGLNIALGGGPAQLTSTAIGVSGIYEGDRLTTGVLLDFLATEGVINSIQSPELTALSGTPTTFTAGGRQRFVTQVGFPTSAVGSASGVTINNVANNTVSTESLSLGLNLTLKPYYYAGIVHADVLMELVDLLRTDTVPTGSTVIQNPVTANRNLSSFVMMRPGQALLLAGIRKKRSDGNAEGLPSDAGGVSAPLLTGAGVEQTELVILMRPRVVVFVETPDDAHAQPRTPSPTGPTAPPGAPPLKLGRAGDDAVSETLAIAPLIGARAASRAPFATVERDLGPWVTRAHLRGADAGLPERAPVSEARAGSFPEEGAENDLSSDSSVTRKTATAALDDGEMLRARWVDRLPVEPNSLTLAQADGRATSLMPLPTRAVSTDPAAATIAGLTLPQLEPQDKTVDLGTVEQGRAQKLLAVWRNGGGRTVRARAPEVIADPETIVTVTADGCSDRDVLPGATCAMKIDVIGKRRGPLRASVSLAHDDGVAAMAIKGTVEDSMQRWATAGPAPKDLEPSTRELRFGVLAAQRAIVLSNRWDSPLAIGQVKLVGGEQAGVAVADDGCSQTDALKPGQNCVIVLRYWPPAVIGEVAADLIVTHAGPTRQLAIAVFGKGDGDESGDRAPAPGEVALLPVPASVMRGGNSDEGTSPSPASFQRASSLAGRQGLRLVGVREDKRLIDDNGTTRLIGAGLVTLAGRTWQASLGKDSVKLAPVTPSGSVGETVELLLGSFGGGGRPGVAK